MRNRTSLVGIAILAGCLSPIAFGQGGTPSQPTDPTAQSPVAPQTTPPTFPAPDARQAPAPDTTSASSAASANIPAGTRTFAGAITRQHGAYMLKTGSDVFKLDDQAKAKEYKGKNVQVTGSLDKSSNTIHVEKIESAASM